ncbi:MAG TPA: Clp protease N-terminal domain-containing protein [Acidimicrobiales bacterium]|nr:Clp protease N-terminal domain-containing protein [Acidimicrobiales bacterium]
MDTRLSDSARAALDHAEEEARRLGSGLVGTEHLLLGLLGDGGNRAARLLLAAGATLDGCRSKVTELAGPPGAKPKSGQLDLTDRARRTLERADRLSLRLRTDHVEPEHILVPLLDVEGRAGQVLRGVGVDVSLLRDAAANDTTAAPTPVAPAPETGTASPRCGGCGSDLSGGLAHRPVTSRGSGRGSIEVVVVHCPGCGTTVGVVPGPSA